MLGKYIAIIAATLLVVAGGVYYVQTVYDKGYKTAQDEARTAALELSSQQQSEIDEVTKDAEKRIDQARADAVAADIASDGLRETVSNLRRSLKNSSTCTASEAENKAISVLSELLITADKRAGDLAKEADESRERGLTCERSYDALSANN
jgi:Protein of unknown function (DUF2514)